MGSDNVDRSRASTQDQKRSRDQDNGQVLGSRKELVLEFGEDNKDEDCELDLVQKLDNLDCMIDFNVIYTSFSNALDL